MLLVNHILLIVFLELTLYLLYMILPPAIIMSLIRHIWWSILTLLIDLGSDMEENFKVASSMINLLYLLLHIFDGVQLVLLYCCCGYIHVQRMSWSGIIPIFCIWGNTYSIVTRTSLVPVLSLLYVLLLVNQPKFSCIYDNDHTECTLTMAYI